MTRDQLLAQLTRKDTITPKQLRGVLDELQVSQARAGRAMGISDRTMRRYVDKEDGTVPRAVALALLAMLEHPELRPTSQKVD